MLVDVLVDMPGLVERFDKMQSCSDRSIQAALRLDLLHDCWEHDRHLVHWRNIVSRLGHPGHDPVSGCCPDGVVVRIAQVHGMSLFYTIGLVLYGILQTVAGRHADLPERVDPPHYARRLAEGLCILLEPSAGLWGQQSAELLLDIALRYTTDSGLSSSDGGRLLESLARKRDLCPGLTS